MIKYYYIRQILWLLFQRVVSVSVFCCASREQINCKTKFNAKQDTVNFISVNAAPCGKLTACHYKAIGHGLIDGNFMNICQPMRLGDFLANKKIQELNFIDSVERDSLKILAVIIPNGINCLSL
jgi:hypothetical protein